MDPSTNDPRYGLIEHWTRYGTLWSRASYEGEEARGRESHVTGLEFVADPRGPVVGKAIRSESEGEWAVMALDGTPLGTVSTDREAAELIGQYHYGEDS